MRNFTKLVCLFSLVSTMTVDAQTVPNIEWMKTYGGNNDDYPTSIVPTPDNGFIVSGITRSIDGDVIKNHGGGDLWVVKLDKNGAITWSKTLGGGKSETGTLVKLTSDGGYLIGGNTNSSNGDVKGYHGGESDLWVTKLSSSGSILWQKALGGSQRDELISLQEVPGVGIFVAGTSNSVNGDVMGGHGGKDMWVVKLNMTGGMVWQRALGSAGSEELYDMIVNTDGSCIVAGRIWQSTLGGDIDKIYGSADLWLVKLTAGGEVAWKRTLGGSGLENRIVIRKALNGDYLLGTSTDSNDGDVSGNNGKLNFWVVKLKDADGGISWARTIARVNGGDLYVLQPTKDGGCVLGGTSGPTANSGETGAMLIVKLNTDGSLAWMKSHGGSAQDELMMIQQTNDDGFICLGFVSSTGGEVTSYNGGMEDAWLFKLDQSGALKWQRSFGGSSDDYQFRGSYFGGYASNGQALTDDMLQRGDGSYYFAVSTKSKDGDVTGLHYSTSSKNTFVGFDWWIVKLGKESITQVAPANTGLLSSINEMAIQAYPNPFFQSTTVQFKAWESARASVDLYDLQGKLLKTIWKGEVIKGRSYQASLNEARLPKGTYIFIITNGTRKESGRLMKME